MGQASELPSFLNYASSLIGASITVSQNTSMTELVAEMSRVLTEYTSADGNTTGHAARNPEGCVDSMVKSLKAVVDFQVQQGNAKADCSLPDSSADCASDVSALLSKYAVQAKAVALAAFDCGGYVDTCTQEIADVHVWLLKLTGSIMAAEQNCQDVDSEFFHGWCDTALLDSIDQFRNLVEELTGVTDVCDINRAEADKLHAAIAEIDRKYGAELPDAILP